MEPKPEFVRSLSLKCQKWAAPATLLFGLENMKWFLADPNVLNLGRKKYKTFADKKIPIFTL